MREVQARMIQDTVKRLFLKANVAIPDDVISALEEAQRSEASPLGRKALEQIIENHRLAREKCLAACQDTGLAVVFVELGQEVHVVGGSLEDALNQGVREAYREGFFRASVVDDPLFERKNTGDNTPCFAHVNLVPGDRVKITAVPKGFGSENMSAIRMLKPSDGVAGVKEFVVRTVREAGPNPCPPVIVGVGIGGTFEKAAELSKRAAVRPICQENPEPRYAELEREILQEVNKLGIGPAGLGGSTTALAVHIEKAPTHIAGLPVAVNVLCHAARRAEETI